MATTTPNYDDLYKVDTEAIREGFDNKATADINESNKTYDNLMTESQKITNEAIEGSKAWAEKQAQIQQEQTDFAIQKIEQQKEWAEKDYTKEQSGAYVDWQKQSGQYGANAEAKAANGLAGSGYSESSQVAMYNQYQNRVAIAREAMVRARTEYDNMMTEARLQNNAALAEIAYNAFKDQMEYALSGFNRKAELVVQKANAATEIKKTYYEQYADEISRIQEENKLKETVRQANLDEAYRQASLKQQREIADAQMAEEKRQFDILHPVVPITPATANTGNSYSETTYKQKQTNDEKRLYEGVKTKLISKANSINTYDAAISFMKNNGISTGGVNLIDSKTWSKAKRTGEQGSELEYSSYKDYVHNYLIWRISESK